MWCQMAGGWRLRNQTAGGQFGYHILFSVYLLNFILIRNDGFILLGNMDQVRWPQLLREANGCLVLLLLGRLNTIGSKVWTGKHTATSAYAHWFEGCLVYLRWCDPVSRICCFLSSLTGISGAQWNILAKKVRHQSWILDSGMYPSAVDQS